eukprot:5814637-Pyramimonas_sp.AAC.1
MSPKRAPRPQKQAPKEHQECPKRPHGDPERAPKMASVVLQVPQTTTYFQSATSHPCCHRPFLPSSIPASLMILFLFLF